MPLEKHWDRVNQPLRETTGRERSVLKSVSVVLGVLAVIAIVAVLVINPQKSAANCVDVVGASTMGGAIYHACGSDASKFCAEHATETDAASTKIQARCKSAGF